MLFNKMCRCTGSDFIGKILFHPKLPSLITSENIWVLPYMYGASSIREDTVYSTFLLSSVCACAPSCSVAITVQGGFCAVQFCLYMSSFRLWLLEMCEHLNSTWVLNRVTVFQTVTFWIFCKHIARSCEEFLNILVAMPCHRKVGFASLVHPMCDAQIKTVLTADGTLCMHSLIDSVCA